MVLLQTIPDADLCRQETSTRSMLSYYFTTFGEVYAGDEFATLDPRYNDHIIVVQASHVQGFTQLAANERVARADEFGWLVAKKSIVDVIPMDAVSKPSRHEWGRSFEGGYDRSLMIIVGAGASANCVTGHKKEVFLDDPLRPPLGDKLFNRRFERVYSEYEGAGDYLFDFPEGTNVEDVLEEEWTEVQRHSNDGVMSRHINVQFYLQDVFRRVSESVRQHYAGLNLYGKLASELQKLHSRKPLRRLSVVSFNQDTLVEDHLGHYFKRPLRSIADYIEVNDSPFAVYKPHGSFNWGWRFATARADWPKFLYNEGTNYCHLYFEYLGPWEEMVDWHGWGNETGLNQHRKGKFGVDKSKLTLFDSQDFGNYFPAILLPYRDKDEFTMPWSHYHTLRQQLSSVETLVIIGWKGNERLFNEQLASYATRINKVIIADPTPAQLEKNLDFLLNRPNLKVVHYNGFEDFALKGIARELA